MTLENTAFQKMGLMLPRWALYDCSIMPGLIVGFAWRTSSIPDYVRKSLQINDKLEWTPISLFICIPAIQQGHWVAHNLCSINTFLMKEHNLSCLGFLTKAFGLSYFNIKKLYGVTQWTSPALNVHTNFGLFQLVTAYTPIHNFAATVTYLVDVDSRLWKRFVEEPVIWENPLTDTRIEVDIKNENTMIELQTRIEKGEGPFYLNSDTEFRGLEKIPVYEK